MLTCKQLADQVKYDVKNCVKRTVLATGNKGPSLAIVSVGNDPASQAYIRGKIKDCEKVGITVKRYELPSDTKQYELHKAIMAAHACSGIIVQLPLPEHLDAELALDLIEEKKDVDGLRNGSPFTPCTALGIYSWLCFNTILRGKSVVIINRSKLVGLPLAKMLIKADATVTVCHSYTSNLHEYIRSADIVVTAVGKHKFLNACMCKNGAVLVDVGINRVDGKIRGDVYNQHLRPDLTVTPVPGGVGLLTRAYLLQNVLKAYNYTTHVISNFDAALNENMVAPIEPDVKVGLGVGDFDAALGISLVPTPDTNQTLGISLAPTPYTNQTQLRKDEYINDKEAEKTLKEELAKVLHNKSIELTSSLHDRLSGYCRD